MILSVGIVPNSCGGFMHVNAEKTIRLKMKEMIYRDTNFVIAVETYVKIGLRSFFIDLPMRYALYGSFILFLYKYAY